MYYDEMKNLTGIYKVPITEANFSPGKFGTSVGKLRFDLSGVKGLFTAKSEMLSGESIVGWFNLTVDNVSEGLSEVNFNIYFISCLYYGENPQLDENGIPTNFYETKILPIRYLKVNPGTDTYSVHGKHVDIPDDQPDDFFMKTDYGLYVVADGWIT